MEKKHQVHNLIILDESGSMQSIKSFIINGFNELVQSIKGIQKQFPEQEHYISIVSFNDLGNKVLHFMDDASKLNEIDASSYNPDSMTPLFDAMGFALTKLKNELDKLSDTEYNVLVTILTDGQENSSKEYTGTAIKTMIEKLGEGNWTFTYIGTDHDVEKIANDLSIKNTLRFEKNKDGIREMFDQEYDSRLKFSLNIEQKKEFKENFYERAQKMIDEFEQQEADKNPKKASFWERILGKNTND